MEYITKSNDLYPENSIQGNCPCLVCLKRISAFESDTYPKLPIEQLQDFLKVCRISLSSFEYMSADELPPRLFCNECTDLILEAVHLLFRIDCLQNEFKLVGKMLEHSLLKNWKPGRTTGVEAVDHIGRTVVQCFTPCEVWIERAVPVFSKDHSSISLSAGSRAKTSARSNNEQDREFESIPNESLRLLYPSIKWNTSPPVKKGLADGGSQNETRDGRILKEESNQDGFSDFDVTADFENSPSDLELEEHGIPSNFDTESQPESKGIAKIKRSGQNSRVRITKGSKSMKTLKSETNSVVGTIPGLENSEQHINSDQAQSEINAQSLYPDRYSYNVFGKIIAFACPFCQKEISQTDYLTSEGDYFFKCFPDCCDKIMNNFRNLVAHHEASCPLTPPSLYSRKRKARTAPKKYRRKKTSEPEASLVDKEHTDLLILAPKSGKRIYDDNKKLQSFECPFCKRVMCREDYCAGEGSSYFFKCFPDCCDKVTDNFSNLVVHHEAFCPSKPKQLYSKKRKSIKKPDPNSAPISVSKGFTYDESGSVASFQCPRCQKQMSPLDFRTETGEYKFRCTWDSCDKTTATFTNYAYHHAVHCSNIPRKAKWKPKKSNIVVIRQGDTLFSCTLCPRKYTDQKSFKTHMRLHIAHRPVLCQTCGKRFRNQTALDAHNQTHEPEYVDCSSCNRIFKNKADLDTHVTRVHSSRAGTITISN